MKKSIAYLNELSPGDILEVKPPYVTLELKDASLYDPLSEKRKNSLWLDNTWDSFPIYKMGSESYFYLSDIRGDSFFSNNFLLVEDISQVVYLGKSVVHLVRRRGSTKLKSLFRKEKWGSFALFTKKGNIKRFKCSPDRTRETFLKVNRKRSHDIITP